MVARITIHPSLIPKAREARAFVVMLHVGGSFCSYLLGRLSGYLRAGFIPGVGEKYVKGDVFGALMAWEI